MDIDEMDAFAYMPTCSMPGCGSAAVYKVAAPWSEGPRRELKTYGLACEAHRGELMERSRARREALRLAEGEAIGAVGLYRLIPRHRDAELMPEEP